MAPDTRLTALQAGSQALVRPTHPIVRMIGLLSRTLLTRWCNSVQVRGMDRFVRLLNDKERLQPPAATGTGPRGIITYANHISVMDDPTIFGALPKGMARQSHTTRWTLGASDIMFTNALFSSFFRAGQVLPTDRGRGVFQPSLDRSVDLLERGGWVHIFPEGYVNMSRQARVRRFKWGIARMLLEAGSRSPAAVAPRAKAQVEQQQLRPLIIPIWISGLDAMMPEPRGIPRWLPRPGANVTITIGAPVNDAVEPVLDRMLRYIDDGKSEKSEGGKLHEIDDTPSEVVTVGGDVSTQADELARAIAEVPHLAPQYPIPSSALFSPRTPLKPPSGGVPWPVPLPESRSAHAVSGGLDSERARLARSLVAAELRAHLVMLGEESGMDMRLAHRLMPDASEV